jgi:hypothetical protein
VGARSLTNVAVAAAVLVDPLLLFAIETGKPPKSNASS